MKMNINRPNHFMKTNDENGFRQGGRWRKTQKMMKLCLLFLCATFLQVSAKTYSQETLLAVKVTNASLEQVMNNIRQQSEFSFFFDDDAVKKISNITLDVRDANIEEVLAGCLKGTGFSFRILDKTIILFREQQQPEEPQKYYKIRGKVVDEKNIAMPGVTVLLDSTQLGVSTDVDGNFTLSAPRETGKLVFSFVGYKTVKVGYNGEQAVNVKMEPESANLEEVQVVAYGSQKKRTVVSSISSVKAEDLKELPTHSLENLLQGHMAGVEISNISGSPGGGGSLVAIRGYNSLFVEGEGDDRNYGTPLYVIDGVPMQSFTSPVTGSNTLSDLDPSMIESIEVLKDAASAAIYGSRAGNGVILITTKKGQAGKARFAANFSYSASWLPEAPEQWGGSYERRYHLNALYNTVAPYKTEDGTWKVPDSYKEVYDNRQKDGPMYNWFWGSTLPQNAIALQDSLNPFYNNSTHWWKQNYHVAKVLNANLQASGGNESVRYMIGAGYYDEEGIAINTGFTRFNVLTNLTANPVKKLRMDTQMSLTYSDRSRGSNAGSNASKMEGITSDPMDTPTLLPGDGEVGKFMLQELNETSEKNQSYSARFNLVLDYEIIRDLHLKLSAGVDFNQQNQNVFKPKQLNPPYYFSSSAGTIARDISLLNENLLSYHFTVKNRHNFDVLVGLAFQKDQGFSNKGSAQNGPSDHVHYVGEHGWGGENGLNNVGDGTTDAFISAFTYQSNFDEERLNSYFGRLTYNFEERYMLEATLRRDGSSVFGENVRWATFPSVAVGWAFSEETFMKRLYWLSFAKIRASWGISGQKFHQPYLAHGLLSPDFYTFHGNAGMMPSTDAGVINKNLSWEETNQYDVGLDISLLDYRFKVNLDYYYRYTSGQLNRITLPGNTHYLNFQWQNGMAISNQGVELELTADIFRETAVQWRMKFNLSRNWNRFEKSSDGFDFNSQIIGRPLHQLMVFKTDGFYNSMDEVPNYYTANKEIQPIYDNNMKAVYLPGARKLIDLNGDGRITSADKYAAASPLPKAHGGFINEIRWKNLDLNIFFNYSIGRHALKIYDDFSLKPDSYSAPLFADVTKLNAWNGADSKNVAYPKPQMYDLYYQYSGLYDCDIEKVHFMRLKQLTLGYNLEEKIVKKIGISSARFFVTAENLFLLTNYSGIDPELIDPTSGLDNLTSYPLPRKFTVGVTLNF